MTRSPALLLAILPLLASQSANAAPPITDVRLDLARIYKWDNSNGDTWDPFWADDDQLYAFNCDGRGFGTQQRNLAFHRLAGDSPHRLIGSLVNSMDAYGAANKKEADGATWKALGQECIDGTFYAFVSRHTYGNESHDPLLRQTAVNSSLIKSTDRGLTWTRPAAENYQSPMWPGPRFGAPYFIHYGRNGGAATRDAADRYVYALSNNGFWNNGDDYILARIERKRLPGLRVADWTYWTGGDGLDARSWSARIDRARPILTLPGQCGSGPACYVPALKTYLLVAWYIPTKLKKWFEPAEMKYDFYQAGHPWGPWTRICSHSDRFLVGGHMYGPSLCARFQEPSGPDVKMSLFTSGCPFEDKPAGLYKMWEIPLILQTAPLPPSVLVNDDDPAITYRGQWKSVVRGGCGYYHDDLHATTHAGDSLELAFTGTAIEYIAEKYKDLGNVDIYIDGALRANVNLAMQNFPRISQVVAFRADSLPAGRHTIRIVSKSGAYAVIDAFQVFSGGGGPPRR
jgi:hypothetical protein